MKRNTLRLAIAGGILIGLPIVLLVGWAVWGSWINPFEKAAMRNCLADIQKVRQLRGVDSSEYRDQVEKTRVDITVCKKRAVTAYDRQLVPLFEIKLDEAIKQQKIWRLPDTSTEKKKMLDSITKTNSFTDSALEEHIK